MAVKSEFGSSDELAFAGWQCPECGYDLRGLRETVCPECGSRFDARDFGGTSGVGLLESIGCAVALGSAMLSVPLAIHTGLEQVSSRFCGGCCRMEVWTVEPSMLWSVVAWAGFAAACRAQSTRRVARVGAIAATTAWGTMLVIIGT